MTTSTTAPAAAPAGQRVQVSTSPIDLDWGSPGDRNRSVSAGLIVDVGLVQFGLIGQRADQRSNGAVNTSTFDSAMLKAGPRGVLSYVRAYPGGNDRINDLLQPLGTRPHVLGQSEGFKLTYTKEASQSGKLDLTVLGMQLGVGVGEKQQLEGEKSLTVTRIPGDRLQVTMAQGYTVKNHAGASASGLGFSTKAVPGTLVASESVSFAFDNTPKGRKALEQLRLSSAIPQAGQPGVSGLTHRLEVTRAQPDGGVLQFVKSTNLATGVTTTTETLDGKSDLNAKLTVGRVFAGPEGQQREMLDKRAYTFEFKVGSKIDAQALAQIDFKGLGINDKALEAITPPAVLKVQFDEKQMQALMQSSALADRNYDKASSFSIRPQAAAGYNADALLASTMPGSDKSLLFAQLVAKGMRYQPNETLEMVRQNFDPSRPGATWSALQILATTTDAAYTRPGPQPNSNYLMDGRVAAVSADAVSVTPVNGPAR